MLPVRLWASSFTRWSFWVVESPTLSFISRNSFPSLDGLQVLGGVILLSNPFLLRMRRSRKRRAEAEESRCGHAVLPLVFGRKDEGVSPRCLSALPFLCFVGVF